MVTLSIWINITIRYDQTIQLLNTIFETKLYYFIGFRLRGPINLTQSRLQIIRSF
jgi:hypothetical protein